MLLRFIPAVLVFGALYILWKLYQILHTAFLTPLARIPGPWYARFTSLPWDYNSIICLKQAQTLHSAHDRYGPIVRISPLEIGISSLEAHRAIHRIGSGFVKSDYYKYLGPSAAGEGPYGLFQMRDVREHRARRSLLARGFGVSALRGTWEGVVREKVERAVQGMAGDGEVVDVRRWWVLMASDVVSEVMFGRSFDGLLNADKEDPFFASVRQSNVAAALAMCLPWLYSILSRLPISALQRMFAAYNIQLDRGTTAVTNARSFSNSKNIFSKILSEADASSKPSETPNLTDAQISYEAAAFMIAGSDTTSNTLTYIVWRVLKDEKLRRDLEEEVAGLEESLTDAEMEKLPILNAVIWEVLRLYPAAPGPEPRVVPEGGFVFEGYHLPAGTVVSTQPWTMHRSAEVFENPETFDHTRWLPGGSAYNNPAANAAWMAFGSGSRTCIGRHLAEMELRHGMACFFRRFRGAKLAESTTEESMDVVDFLLMQPKSGRCEVILPLATREKEEKV